MSKFAKLVLFCSIFTLAVTTTMFPSTNLIANGASACPAFTSAMVDAAAMAFGLSSQRVNFTAGDDPTTPEIFCHAVSDGGADNFILEVNYSEPNWVVVWGWSAREGEPGETELFSEAEQLSSSQMRACRAAILKTFVWNNYCAPKNSGFILN